MPEHLVFICPHCSQHIDEVYMGGPPSPADEMAIVLFLCAHCLGAGVIDSNLRVLGISDAEYLLLPDMIRHFLDAERRGLRSYHGFPLEGKRH